MRWLATLGMVFAVNGLHAVEPTTLRVYFIGNSVTDTVRYGEFAKLGAARQQKLIWGRTMIPGAPLEWLFKHPNDGFQEPPFGRWQQALTEYAWDVLSLQPFDRHLKSRDPAGEDMGDVARIRAFAELAAKKYPDVQVYVYARWPRVARQGKSIPFDKNDYDPTRPGSGNDLSKIDAYADRWDRKYTGGWDNSNETRDYFDRLLVEVRKETPFLKKPALLVPVGHVMRAVDEKMRAGQVPGYSNIYQFYKDGIHLNVPGSYLVGCTFYGTLWRQSPVGLPSTPYGTIDPALAELLQKTAWEVVSRHPEAGIARAEKSP